MSDSIKIVEFPERKFFGIKCEKIHTSKLCMIFIHLLTYFIAESFGPCYGVLYKWVQENKCVELFKPCCWYLDCDLPNKIFTFIAGFFIPKDSDFKEVPDQKIIIHDIPAGKFALSIHKGAYAKCSTTWESIKKWVEENNAVKTVDCNDNSYEHYLNDPAMVKEEELETEIYWRVEEKKRKRSCCCSGDCNDAKKQKVE